MSKLARILLGALAACTTVKAGVECTFSPCVNSYHVAYGGQCGEGFNADAVLVGGGGRLDDPRRTYCHRPCTSDEAKSCYTEQCKIDESGCNNGPESLICKDAMEKCFKPIKMHKKICTERFMKQPVAFDEAAGTCAYDKNAKPSFNVDTDDLTFRVDYGDIQQEIIFSCLNLENPRQLAGLAQYINCKRIGHKGVAFHCIQNSQKSGFRPDVADKVFGTKCKMAKAAPGKKTEYVKKVISYKDE